MLIRTNALRSLVEAEAGGNPVTDRWGEISRLLTERCGSDVAALFAEPSITRSNGASESIARWYSDADGPAVSYSALDAGARGTAAAQLTALLSRLEPALSDPATAGLIGPCVQIPSMADIMIVGGRPVISNWGFLPEDVVASPARRESHFRTTLGQFLPGASVPTFNVTAGAASAAGAARALGATTPVQPAAAAALGAAAPGVAAAVAPVVVAETRYRPWLPVAIATAVALGVLLVLLFGHVLIYPQHSTASADDVALRRQINQSLQEYVDRLQRQSATQVCTAQNPGGQPPVGAQPGDGQAAAADGTRPLGNAQLLAGLEKATVLVIVASDDGSKVESIGSGFFVNEKQIVTNRHVVQNAKPGRVFVVNKTLTRPLPARVAGISTAPQQTMQDFALLEVPQATGIQGLALAGAAERLNPVTAAGFTGVLIASDPSFKRLLEGDLAAMPEMVVTQGIVTVIQQTPGSATLVFHTATISGGNSGGPLADACGRLVAVNTFNKIDPQRPIAFNGALSSTNLAQFLDAGNVTYLKATGACDASAAVSSAAPAPGAPPAAPVTPAPPGPEPAAPAAPAAPSAAAPAGPSGLPPPPPAK